MAEHTYLSTSCHPAHHDHADCRRTCKHCSAPCVCAGHAADGDTLVRPTLPEIVAERDRLAAAVRVEAERHLGPHSCFSATWFAKYDCPIRAGLIAALTREGAS